MAEPAALGSGAVAAAARHLAAPSSCATAAARVLVVGSGPAGLEAAVMLGRRGHEVALAEAGTELGGRVARERKLPGLAAWGRVADYRVGQLASLPNVEIYRGSRLAAGDVLSLGFDQIVVATGSRWRRDGVARRVLRPVPVEDGAEVLTPDDLLDGMRPKGKAVTIYDDDHYYIGSVLAELLVREGYAVSFVTPAVEVSNWMRMTMEQQFVQARLIDIGVTIVASKALTSIRRDGIDIACAYTGRPGRIEGDAVVLVTARLPENGLAKELDNRRAEWGDAGIAAVTVIGDALAPGTIAAAVYAGRKFAEELGAGAVGDGVPFRREVAGLVRFEGPWQPAPMR